MSLVQSTSAPSVPPASSQQFAEQVYAHDTALRLYLRRSFPDARAELDDIVQESYLRVLKARASRPLASTRAFLFTVARNVTLDLLRRARISPAIAPGVSAIEFVLDDRPGVVETVSRAERIHALTQALVKLPPRSREVVVLRYFRGLPQHDVAAQLGISEKTVEDHVTRGMKRLGACLRAQGYSSHFET